MNSIVKRSSDISFSDLPVGSWLGTVASSLSSDVCEFSDDHWHHADSVMDSHSRGDGTFDIKCRCKNCNQVFTASGITSEQLSTAYNAYVDTLETPIISSTGSMVYRCTPGRSSYSVYYMIDSSSGSSKLVTTTNSSDACIKIDYDYGATRMNFAVYALKDIYLPTYNTFLYCYYNIPTSVIDGVYYMYCPSFNQSFNGSVVNWQGKFITYSYGGYIASYSSIITSPTQKVVGSSELNSLADKTLFVSAYGYTNIHAQPEYSPYCGYVDYPVLVSKSLSGGRVTAPATSRLGSVSLAINNYNKSAAANDTKYYIGTVDNSNHVTNTYNVNLFDEDTKTFTEPKTGAQYLCKNWTYYYDQRAYLLELADNSMTYNGNTVGYLAITYGDNEMTISGWKTGTSNVTPTTANPLFTDKYVYVISEPVAPGTCEHEFTWSITTPATCTAAGERTGTCSKCGGVTKQAIEQLPHDYAYTTTTEATCTTTGERTGTCSVCGAAVTEEVQALGHDWRKIKDVETEYNEDGTIKDYSHTLYECARCKEQAKSYDGNAPPGGSSGGSGSTDTGLLAWLAEFREWLDDTLTTGFTTVETTLSKICDKLDNTATTINNTIVNIDVDNTAYNVFYITTDDGSKSVTDFAGDLTKGAGKLLSMLYRLVFSDAVDGLDDDLSGLEDFFTAQEPDTATAALDGDTAPANEVIDVWAS